MINLYLDVRCKMHYRGVDSKEVTDAILKFNKFKKTNVCFKD